MAALQAQPFGRGGETRDLVPQGRPAIKGTARRQDRELARLVRKQRGSEAAQARRDHAREQFLDQGQRTGEAGAIARPRQLARQLVQDQVIHRNGRQRGNQALVRRELAVRRHGHGAPDAAVRQQRQRVAFLGLQIGHGAGERISDDFVRQRAEPQLGAARPDCRGKRPGPMADKDQHGARRRLFERLQQRVGGVAIYRFRTVDDCHPIAAGGRRHLQRRGRRPHRVDGDLGTEPPGTRVALGFQHRQIGMDAPGHLAEHGMVRGHRESPIEEIRARQERPGKAEAERRLAYAGRPCEQPAVRQPARGNCAADHREGRILAVQLGVIPRREDARGHGRCAAPPRSMPKRRTTRSRISSATTSTGRFPSTTTQRSGWARASARKPARTCS